MSIAERRRARKRRTVSLGREIASRPAAHEPAPPAAASAGRLAAVLAAPKPREDGIAMLRGKGRLNARQAWAARTYGALERTANLPDGASIRSFLDMTPGGGGVAIGALAGADWVLECRIRLARAHQALNWHAEVIAVLSMICAHGYHPREITAVQREAEQIETGLIIALDMLITHWRGEGFSGVGGWPENGLAQIK